MSCDRKTLFRPTVSDLKNDTKSTVNIMCSDLLFAFFGFYKYKCTFIV